MRQMVRKAKIIGTGSYVPETIYTNEYLATIVDTDADWVYKTLGIRERRIAAQNQATSDLASIAAMRAIENSGLTPADINLIIVATATPDRLAPSTACFVQHKIEAYNAVAFDVAAVCSGFLYALSVATQFIASGVYDNVLCIGADTFSKVIDWNRRDCVFFGDGAGAAVLSHCSDAEGFWNFRLYSDGRGTDGFTIPAGGSQIPASHASVDNNLHSFRMNGRAVYETATEVLPKAIMSVLQDCKLSIDEIDYMIPHQPSIEILKRTAEKIGLPWGKVMTNMEWYANTSGGTIPILLDEVNRAGKLYPNKKVLFAAVGSGWTWGAGVYIC
ncbi:ketoacyl-ACP synthase III [Candidatus Cloacimonadota bacterium]